MNQLTDGELKKRGLILFDIRSNPPTAEVLYLPLSVLNEAKKDFSWENLEIYKIFQDTAPDDRTHMHEIVKTYQKVIKKWFGE